MTKCWWRHTWRVFDQREQPSPIEIAAAHAIVPYVGPINMATRPVIVTYHCAVCFAEKVERI
jgi:hypothetical protein